MFNAIISADWHIGAIDPRQFQKQIRNTLINKLEDLYSNDEGLDAIFIAGDIFDSKQYFASEAVAVAFDIFSEILSYQEVLGFSLYIIDGTRTHDAGQLSYLVDIMTTFVDGVFGVNSSMRPEISLISEVTATNILKINTNDNISVLFIPEEYVADQDEYYKEAFSNHYDFIIGHGMIDKIWYAKKDKEENTNKILYAPVFELDKLTEVGEYSFFGHVHTHKLYKDGRFRYLGPVTRWEFGSMLPVGITYIEYDEVNKTMITDEFIENKEAPYLPTEIINLMNDKYEIDQVNEKIDNAFAEHLANGASKVRFIVNLNSKLENFTAIKNFLTTKIGDMPIAKLVLSTDFDKDVVDNMKDSIEEQERKSLDYVFNRDLELEERIRQFISKKMGKEISIEKLKEYLTNE